MLSLSKTGQFKSFIVIITYSCTADDRCKSMKLFETEHFYYFSISAVLNLGWCHKVNSLKTHQLLHEGDYHTTDSDHQFTITNLTSSVVKKDLVTEIVTLSEIGMY